MQFRDAFKMPSSNQRTCTSPVKLVFFTLVKGLIQCSRFACSRQNLSGSASEASYIRKYPASSTQALRATDSGTGNKLVFDMGVSLPMRALRLLRLRLGRRVRAVSPPAPRSKCFSAHSLSYVTPGVSRGSTLAGESVDARHCSLCNQNPPHPEPRDLARESSPDFARDEGTHRLEAI